MNATVRLDHCVVAVTDWERSNRFYVDVLGAELRELTYGRFAYGFGEQQLNIHGPGSTPHPRAADPVRPGNSDVCFVWPGPIADAARHLEEHGVAVEEGPVERLGAVRRWAERLFPRPGRKPARVHLV